MAQADNHIMKPVKKSRPWLWRIVALLLVLAIAAVIVHVVRSRAQLAESSGIRSAQVTRGNVVQTVTSTGVVAAQTGADVKIGSQITGTIKQLNTDVGRKVQAGQTIAVLDAPDLQANVDSARQNLAQASTHYQQQLSGVPMQHTQVQTAFEQATDALHVSQDQADQASDTIKSADAQLSSSKAALAGAQANEKSAESALRSAQANAKYQPEQTSADIAKAKAALSSAQSAQAQTQKSVALEVAASEAAVKQAESQLKLANATLDREEKLLVKGYVAPQDVDTARSAQEVAAQQLDSANSALGLTQEKVKDDLQAAADQVTEAQAALAAAQSETYQNTVKTEAVSAAESGLASAQAQVTQAQTAVESASSALKSAYAQKAAALSGIANAQQAQKAALGNMTQDVLKQQDVRAAYEAMRQAQAQVTYNLAQLDKANIRTPISGTVVSLTQQQGETVAAGLSAPTLIEVVDLSKLEVDAYVDETDIAQVKLGQAAAVTVDAFQKKTFTGKVTKISSASTLQDNVVTYMVTVALDKYPEGKLKPQMTANITLTVSEKDNVLLVPSEAIKQKKGTGTQKPTSQVVVLKGPNQGEVRSVTVGVTDGKNTEIQDGLKEGEQVVLAGFDKLGLADFSSAAKLPGFMNRSALGTTSSSASAGRGGGTGGAGGGGK
jgi:RND family efflux transporter MFP subunit